MRLVAELEGHGILCIPLEKELDRLHLTNGLKSLSRERIARVRQAMEHDGLDLLIVASPENVHYATGYESMGATINRRYGYTALISLERLQFVAPAIDFAPAIEDAGVSADDIHPYGNFFFSGHTSASHNQVRNASFQDAFASAFARLGGAGKICAEIGYLPVEIADLVYERCENMLDANAWMLKVRSVKLPFEIELLRMTTEITQDAIEAGIAAAAVGRSERAVASVVAAEMAKRGALPRNVTVVGGLRSALADAFSSERLLEAGDLLRFDVGCSYYGYKSDMARTAVLGEPSATQASRYSALLAGLETAIDLATVGRKTSDIFDGAVAAVEKAGLKPYRRNHTGHAIGMAVYEYPVVAPQSNDRLQEGATFCLETPYYEPGWGGMMVEDTGLVTDSGFELFSTIDRSLRVIPT